MSTPKKAPRTPSARKTSPTGQLLGLEDVKNLLALVSKEGISEFEYESPSVRLRIRKETGQSATFAAPPPPPTLTYSMPGAPTQSVLATTAPQAPSSPEAPAEEPGIHYITCPIVGTFYRSPNPNSAPFVQVGDRVKPGQTLCIVEAMKLMNEIECDMAGEVVKVLLENGQPVEYGERLYAIRLG
jgi:acetyl-CoA carboxylase biotin carboxyl carrier protein